MPDLDAIRNSAIDEILPTIGPVRASKEDLAMMFLQFLPILGRAVGAPAAPNTIGVGVIDPVVDRVALNIGTRVDVLLERCDNGLAVCFVAEVVVVAEAYAVCCLITRVRARDGCVLGAVVVA